MIGPYLLTLNCNYYVFSEKEKSNGKYKYRMIPFQPKCFTLTTYIFFSVSIKESSLTIVFLC